MDVDGAGSEVDAGPGVGSGVGAGSEIHGILNKNGCKFRRKFLSSLPSQGLLLTL